MSQQRRPERERHLSFDDVKFFERAMDAYKSVKNTAEANDFFVPISQELQGKEILVAQHKTCSRFMESYIQECPITSVQKLFAALLGTVSHLAAARDRMRGAEIVIFGLHLCI